MPAQRTPPTFYVSTDVPPLLIRMLWQIDVGNEPFRTLTWSEEVPPRAQMKPRQIHRASVLERYSGLIPSSRPNAIIHSNAHAVQLIGASTNTSAGQQKLLPLTDLGVSSPEEESDDGEEKIKKPSGEVGRPGRGGYNLEVALGWARDDFEKIKESEASSMIKHLTSIQAYVHRLAADHLDMSKALSFQRKEAIDVVCCKVCPAILHDGVYYKSIGFESISFS